MKNHKKTDTLPEEEKPEEAAQAQEAAIAVEPVPAEKETRHSHATEKTDKGAKASWFGGKRDKAAEEKKLAELEERNIRLLADFDNFRKRSVRERDEISRQVRENILKEFLPIIDNLELGLNAAVSHNADSAFVEGYRMVSGQLTAALARLGLTPVFATGVAFDSAMHDAIQQMPSESVPEGMVLEVVRKGYLVNDKLIRTAQVVVSSGPSTPAKETAAEESSAVEE